MNSSQRSAALLPYVLMLLMNAVWGLSYSGIKLGLEHFTPLGLVMTRFWVAVLCLLPLLRTSRKDLRATMVPGALTGLALLSGYVLQAFGMTETSASMGGFLAGLIVLLVGLGAWLMFREPLTSRSVVGIAFGIAGLVLLCSSGADPSEGGQVDTLRGILLQIGSSCCFAAHILMISRLSPLPDLAGLVDGKVVRPDITYCMWQLVTVSVGASLILFVSGESTMGTKGMDATTWYEIGYLGLVATAIGIAVQSRYQPLVRPSHLALLFATQPGFAALGGWLLMGDQMFWQHGIGSLCIVAGILISGRRD